ncbi:uncharacterized protein LOC123547470 [Mercenaria mercenaria]|uniref:uncharacterized protein LOC123547470 n=1 Tax=Mercenaria mercenaria TaxID=6596 RepID=UPI00234F4360|nr:uncharacterized protein LOC123547470 [Mercenaria mercenaria]
MCIRWHSTFFGDNGSILELMMKITVHIRSTVTYRIFIWLFCLMTACEGSLREYFGNALRQDIKAVTATDSDVVEVIKYVQQYTRKRYPWNIPSQGLDPVVTQLSKKLLIYTHDGETPLFFEDEVKDRSGLEHGVTRFIPLGAMYDFVLSWTESMVEFCHNYTVSVYPKDRINIYTHTFYLQNLNITNPGTDEIQYLFPKVGSSYFKYLAGSEHVGQFSYTSEFSHLETEEAFKGYSGTPGAHSDQLEGGSGIKSSFTDKSGSSKRLRVMTYNIWNMNSKSTRAGGYTERMKRLKEAILKTDPDVIALQEVRYEEAKGEDLGPCQIHTLSEWLPQYQFVFQPAQMQMNTVYEGRTEEGVAIMSKYPIISYDSIMLFINRSNSADTHQRVLLQADIFIPSVGMVHIFNTHLSLSHEAREKCAVQIWNHVKPMKGPVLVLGDLNAEPHELSVQYLRGQDVFPGEDRSELVDVWSKLNPDDKGLTFGTLDKNLTKRIDYIFYRGGVQCCDIEACYIPDDGGRGYKAASDHLPLMAVLSLKTKTKHSTDSS